MFWSFLFGAVIGSFLNVCIYRLPRDKSIIRPGSRCPTCEKPIAWYDNIPVVSYLVLRGKCRYCGARISPRYLLVELLTASLFFIVARRYGFQGKGALCLTVSYWLFVAGLVVATFVDLEHRIIPDEISLGGTIAAILCSLICPSLHAGDPLTENVLLNAFLAPVVGIVTGAGLIFITGALGTLVFRKPAMGFGDVKLMGMIGGFLGWKISILVFFLAPIMGSIIGLIAMLRWKTHYIPYGPFLAAAAIIGMLWGKEIWHGLFPYL